MKKHSRSILGVLIIILLILISGCNDKNNKPDSSEPSADKSHVEFEACIDKLGECFSDISAGSQLFFRENKRIPFTTNTEAYKILIKEGVKTCVKWEASLRQMSASDNAKNNTKALIQVTREYVNNQKLFYKCLLNYADSGKYVDIQLSNKYSRRASENMKSYNAVLIKALKENNYYYEIKDGYINFDSKL